MKTGSGIVAALLVGMAWLAQASAAPGQSGQPIAQSFAGSGAAPGMESATSADGRAAGALAAADAADTSPFAEGTRAINESRWADAVSIFANVAGQHGEHADGALYWEAYAEYRLGRSKLAEDTCAKLRSGYAKSRWIDDCGALEVEIQANSGKPVEIEPWQSDDVKLLALHSMMRQNEARALAEIQAILNGDASERLKKEAQTILGEHYSDVTYDQIVRISYVEGDVRIQRGEPNGKADGKASGATWEKAVADLPLETGFSLVTGEGRAEIEFESASTLYLGENSVLTFNDLHETAGVPYTELALLSGTASMYIHPYMAGERFLLHTPTDDILSKYPDKTYARVESFADAVSITPLEGSDVRLPGVSKFVAPGRTWIHSQGAFTDEQEAGVDQEFAAWDKWVGDRVAQRNAAISQVMEASGLAAPIPGMAEMAGQGKFFDCAPYGTCWAPNEIADQEEAENRQRVSQRPRLVLASYDPSAAAGQDASQSGTGLRRENDYMVGFPCSPLALRYRTVKDPVTGKTTVIDSALVPRTSYGWAVCHAGSWIHHRKHYVWVAGCKRHHVDPVRWVKSEHKMGFVPLHPYDVKGQPPVNAKHEVFVVTGKNEVAVRPEKLDPGRPMEFLNEAPKEYRNALLRPLALTEAPRMEAHAFSHAPENKGVEVSRAAIPIHFDAKSLSFTMPKEETRGGKTVTVNAPVSNRSGSLQARGGSYGGGSGSHSSGGGGSHSGGSSSGSSGGGSHSGGGSSSSSSSSSGSSSGGGGHH